MLGRDGLLVDVVKRVQAGRHVLLTGESGIGKSRLLREVYEITQGKRVVLHPGVAAKKRRRHVELKAGLFTAIWIKEAIPLSSLLEELMFQLAGAGGLATPNEDGTGYADPSSWPAACTGLTQKQIRKLYSNARDRRQAILHSLRQLHPAALVFIDAVDRASPSMSAFLLALQKECTIVTAVREIQPSQSLATFFKTFGSIKVDKLSGEAMRALCRYFIRTYHIQVVDPHYYENEVVSRADGNPAALRAIMHDGAQAKLVTNKHVRALQRRDDAPYFNMGIIYVFLLIGATFLRTFLTGSWDTDWYILVSTFAIAGFVIFRVFRPFFMFYPTRKRA